MVRFVEWKCRSLYMQHKHYIQRIHTYNMQVELIQKAYGIGVEAFMSGKTAIPSQDRVFCDFLRENHIKVGQGAELMHQWTKGFVDA